MRILISSDGDSGYLSDSLNVTELANAFAALSTLKECKIAWRDGEITMPEVKCPKVSILPDDDPRLPGSQQDSLVKYNKELQQSQSKLYSEKWELERKVRALTTELEALKNPVVEEPTTSCGESCSCNS